MWNKLGGRKFVSVLSMILVYYTTVIVFLCNWHNPAVAPLLEFLKLLTPSFVFTLLGYGTINIVNKKVLDKKK